MVGSATLQRQGCTNVHWRALKSSSQILCNAEHAEDNAPSTVTQETLFLFCIAVLPPQGFTEYNKITLKQAYYIIKNTNCTCFCLWLNKLGQGQVPKESLEKVSHSLEYICMNIFFYRALNLSVLVWLRVFFYKNKQFIFLFILV